MQLFPDLAKKIITEVKKLIDENVIVIDLDGMIIASTDESRIGTLHEGGVITSKQNKTLIITEQDERNLKGVKAGINLPIVFHQNVIGVIGITGNPSEVSQYGELLKKMTELLIHENHYKEQIEWRQRNKEAYVWEWLQEKAYSTDFHKQGAILGIDMERKRCCILIKLENSKNLLQHELFQFIQYRIGPYTEDVLIRWGHDRIVWLQAVESELNKTSLLEKFKLIQRSVYDRFNATILVGIGGVAAPNRLNHCYKQAEKAVLTASSNNSIVFEDELQLELCLQEISKETKQEYINRTIEPLLQDEELLETLHTYISNNQSQKQSAKKLNIHINTLHYRLKRIDDITNLDPKNFTDLATLYFSLRLLDDFTKN
jgi:carbohydrate diacid regulator